VYSAVCVVGGSSVFLNSGLVSFLRKIVSSTVLRFFPVGMLGMRFAPGVRETKVGEREAVVEKDFSELHGGKKA